MARPFVSLSIGTPQGISRRKFLGQTAGAAALSLVSGPARTALGQRDRATTGAMIGHLRVDTSRAINSFDPDKSLGSSMDDLSMRVVQKIYTPEMVKQWLSAGWGPITYRLHTELSIEAWHWNSNGKWSDPANKRGYFVGDAEPAAEPIHDSFAYPLPHRGTTADGGASSGFSRLTDGDLTTFWKSNPYLTQQFTGEDDSLHPQWIILDMQTPQEINALRIDWCEPNARVYEVQYWSGVDPMNWEAQYDPSEGLGVAQQVNGRWNRFADGIVTDGKSGTATLKLCKDPITTRWIRVVMTQSSNKAGPHGTDDVRDRVGYAIYQVYAGTLLEDGTLVDLVQHTPTGNQTPTYCSSTDPYHSAADLSKHGDQTGLDLFFTSGITNNLPAMIPVAVLFSTPENAANQIAYLKKRGYSVGWVEMGEECDGQYILPEDYAALYIQFADAIHKVAPEAKLGGPVFQGINQDVSVWPDGQNRSSWFGRFLDYLKAHNHVQDLSFVSFEHYPFDPCAVNWSDLYREPELTRNCLEAFRNDGLPEGVPLMNTESALTYDLSYYMTDIFSALWLADSVGSFFYYGGSAYYHSPIQAEALRPGCHGGWATYGNYVADSNLQIHQFTAEYHVGRMINREWVTHGTGVHHLFPVEGTISDPAGHALVTSYAVRRPDGDWALLIINKDQNNPHDVQVAFAAAENRIGYFDGPVDVITFGSEQYVWHSAGAQSHADPDDPPRATTVSASKGNTITLPKASVTVLRGKVQGLEA
ncbi:MAG: discoidin domain-containing protein [Candidatus Acidiferrales bacterium]